MFINVNVSVILHQKQFHWYLLVIRSCGEPKYSLPLRWVVTIAGLVAK